MTSWPLKEVYTTPNTDHAVNDLYGKLFVYIHGRFVAFANRLAGGIDATFEMYNLDVVDLPGCLGDRKFARVEVSNLADDQFLGPIRTLACLAPLLQRRGDNPHATLIILHMNAVHETWKKSALDLVSNAATAKKNWKLVTAFVPFPEPFSMGTADFARADGATNLLIKDKEKHFKRYVCITTPTPT